MLYNDFNILDDGEYQIINLHYQQSKPQTQSEIVNKLFVNFDQCKSFCFGLNKCVNKRIQAVLVNAKSEFEKLISNVNTTFKIDAKTTKVVSAFSVFDFANKLIEGLKLAQEFLNLATDPKLTDFAKQTTKTILDITDQLFNALANSNIQMFKYM